LFSCRYCRGWRACKSIVSAPRSWEPGTALASLTLGAVKIIEVQFGSYLGENGIVRPQDDYGGT